MRDSEPVAATTAGRIVPELSVRGGLAAIEFYRAAFGAVVDYRVGGTDENEAVVAIGKPLVPWPPYR